MTTHKTPGVYIDKPRRPTDECNFIHRENDYAPVLAVVEVRFQLSGNYAQVTRMCQKHLDEMVREG